jgi:phage baseplate assembly protein gpV
MSDGFYIGGFWGKAPEVFIHLEQAGTIEIEAPQAITIKAERVSIEADALAEIKAPQIVLDGAITGGGSGQALATFTGDVTAQGVSLVHHTHGGVSSGPDDTGEPNGGGA